MAVELAAAYLSILPSMKGMQSAIRRELDEIDTDAPGQKMGSGLGSGIAGGVTSAVGVAGAAIAGLAAVGAAAGAALGKAVLTGYAQYEQNLGGIETMFKDSAGKMEGYANQAYKTAGVSANEYMSQVTSFSAALLQGLGGDTESAAEAANRAMVDMSDNANKFGTDVGSIQNAYQGFAKQNYTMLDNLKLGFGGTAAEMARLVNESGVMGDGFVATAQNINDVSFDRIVDAIHVVQDQMGIAGTTSLEAEKTISGAAGMLKASFENLLTGLGSTNSDVGQLSTNVLNSLTSLLANVSPVIAAIGANLPSILPALKEALGGIVGIVAELLPIVLEAGVSLITALVEGISIMLPTVLDTLLAMLPGLVDTLMGMLPTVLDAAVQLFTALVEALPVVLPLLLTAIIDLLPSIVGALISLVPVVLSTAVTLFANLVTAVFQTDIASAIGEKISGAIDTIAGFGGRMLESGRNLINSFKEGIIDSFNNVKNIVSDKLSDIRGLFPFSPAKEGPFSGKGYTTFSGRALARDFGDAIADQAGYVRAQAESLLDSAYLGDAAFNTKLAVVGGAAAGGFPSHVTLRAEDGTMLGVFRTVADERVNSALAPVGAGALASKLGRR